MTEIVKKDVVDLLVTNDTTRNTRMNNKQLMKWDLMSPENDNTKDMSHLQIFHCTSLSRIGVWFTFLIINKLLVVWFSITYE